METKKILVASYEEILSPKKNEDRSYIIGMGSQFANVAAEELKIN